MAGELLFKRWFREDLKKQGVWSEAIEPARGTGVGMPDLVILFGGMHPFFVELKVGRLAQQKDSTCVLRLTEIRPAQYSWHRNYQRAGGISCTVVGVQDGAKWKPFVLMPFTQEEFMAFGKSNFVGFDKIFPWVFSGGQIGDYEVLARKLGF